jgi:hypothetical protein
MTLMVRAGKRSLLLQGAALGAAVAPAGAMAVVAVAVAVAAMAVAVARPPGATGMRGPVMAVGGHRWH